MGQECVQLGITCWEGSPSRPRCQCVRGACFGGNPLFLHFLPRLATATDPGISKEIKKTNKQSLFHASLLGWLTKGSEVTAGVTLSVCPRVPACVPGLARPAPLLPGSSPRRPTQASWEAAGSGPPAWARTPPPPSPPLAQGAHAAEGCTDPPPLPQASWPVGNDSGVAVAGGGDSGGTGGEADRFPAAAGAG